MSKLLQEMIDAAFTHWLNDDRANAYEIKEVMRQIADRIRERYHLGIDEIERLCDDLEDAACAAEETAFFDGFLYCYQLFTGREIPSNWQDEKPTN